ncbi:NAD(P)H-hydrate dehydratase [uncultured Tateyamaria sp.]|uniref:NAD(P)H-hydrate dehydratase n=1 Tax=uncultured Tateyamaria sp. TaxID=455651 RepID=UPI0026148D66|nr:NAD(P)H-hydrate dehydratase [uncultured Tateyamaria sp.]
MTELLTQAQMRAIEQAAIESGQVTGLELMERAGAGVVEGVFEEWPELSEGAHRAVVLCGPGNNGGDGFVVARLLAERGWTVEVFLYGDAERLPSDAKTNCERWRKVGRVSDMRKMNKAFETMDLFVDGGFGTGLRRALPTEFQDVFQWQVQQLADRMFSRNVAIDVPSGICSDSGKQIGPVSLVADLIVTFHRAKVGVYMSLPFTPDVVRVKPIGLDENLPSEVAEEQLVRLVDVAEIDRPNINKHRFQHKFDHGHALILSGGAGRTGAARLAARGALRIGAGLVTLGVPPAAQMEVASQVTALMLTRVSDAHALSAVLEDQRINALCLGPGLGLHDQAAALLDVILDEGHLSFTRRVVFDADSLTLIAQDAQRMDALNENAILTPHGGEFARLFPDIAASLQAIPDQGPAYSKVDATRHAAARCGAVVVFKGHDTVIAHPDGRCSVHAAAYGREAPWLATAGAGDVLAGFITGLLARGLDPMAAAGTAAWLHIECARRFGPGLIAEDLPEMLPRVLRDVGV